VRVMAAGVHHAGLGPVGGLGPDLGGELQTRLFGNGQGVHVGADQQHGAGSVLQHRDYACTAHLFGDGELHRFQPPGELGGGGAFLFRQFGIGVQVTIERHQPVHVLRDGRGDDIGRRCHLGGCAGRLGMGNGNKAGGGHDGRQRMTH